MPFCLLASVYEKPSTWPVFRPKRPWRLGPILLPSDSTVEWHCAHLVLKRLAPFFASPISDVSYNLKLFRKAFFHLLELPHFLRGTNLNLNRSRSQGGALSWAEVSMSLRQERRLAATTRRQGMNLRNIDSARHFLFHLSLQLGAVLVWPFLASPVPIENRQVATLQNGLDNERTYLEESVAGFRYP